VKRDPESRKELDFPLKAGNDENKNFCDRLNNEWLPVLILTDCDQAPLRGQQS
jgi:hypothetical protein